MLMRNPGKGKVPSVLGAVLILVMLIAVPALGEPKDEAGSGTPTPAPNPEPEINFNGKVFCALKRRVDLPFKGIITSILVSSGDQVKAGQVLARYTLTPEAQLAIHQRLSPPAISEVETKLAETERTLVPLYNQQRELRQLLQKKLAPPRAWNRSTRISICLPRNAPL